MNLLKLITFLTILLSGLTHAESDLDSYYTLEKEVVKLRAEFRDNQELISKHNTTSNHLWSPSSTKKVLARIHKDQDKILKKMKPKIKEMRRLEQTLEVKAWDYRFRALEKVNTILGNVSENNTCSAQGLQLFVSDKAFEAWNAQNGDLDRKVAYYAKKNGYINNCLGQLPTESEKKVNYKASHLCRWPNTYFGNPVSYQVSKETNTIVLSTKLYFKYKGRPENKQKSVKAMTDVLPCLKDFYAKHGIKLNITFEFGEKDSEAESCNHNLNLWDETNRANPLNWVSHKSTGYDIGMEDEPKNRCALALHELGHLFGFGDSYPRPDCPDQKIGPSNDIMRRGAFKKPFEVEITRSDIIQILRPLCEQ